MACLCDYCPRRTRNPATPRRILVCTLFSAAGVMFTVRVVEFLCVFGKQLVQRRLTFVHVTAVPVEIGTLLL
jgi:Na+/phosphate symporter